MLRRFVFYDKQHRYGCCIAIHYLSTRNRSFPPAFYFQKLFSFLTNTKKQFVITSVMSQEETTVLDCSNSNHKGYTPTDDTFDLLLTSFVSLAFSLFSEDVISPMRSNLDAFADTLLMVPVFISNLYLFLASEHNFHFNFGFIIQYTIFFLWHFLWLWRRFSIGTRAMPQKLQYIAYRLFAITNLLSCFYNLDWISVALLTNIGKDVRLFWLS